MKGLNAHLRLTKRDCSRRRRRFSVSHVRPRSPVTTTVTVHKPQIADQRNDDRIDEWPPATSVIFVNENENENGEKRDNNEFVNEN